VCDDVREIIEAVRYSAVSARYKVYIIDEVHMLSKNAFNALLKTLEEPPAHIKFLFATTEVNKVPVTVLSRCQRFDLRRIPADKLARHFAKVIEAEGAQAESEALSLIARAAEGSARDGLSILDQAIAHADMEGGAVAAAQVREMLGLSDRGAVRSLLGHLLSGDAQAALGDLRDQYDLGVDPVGVLRGLLEAVHGVTMAKMGGGADPSQSAEEREALGDWASRLSFAQLHRLWQLLLKGHDEAVRSAMPLEAAEMALLRIVHAAELPDPAELLKRMGNGEAVAAPAPARMAAPPPAPPAPAAQHPESFPALVDLLGKSGKPLLAQQLHDFVGLQRYAPPELAVKPLKPMGSEFFRDLAAALKTLTSAAWTVGTDDGDAQPSLLDQERAVEAAAKQAILDTPLVKAAFEAFPDAELIDYSAPEQRSAS
jgi:DNA polymerase III subunit gamma/tau